MRLAWSGPPSWQRQSRPHLRPKTRRPHSSLAHGGTLVCRAAPRSLGSHRGAALESLSEAPPEVAGFTVCEHTGWGWPRRSSSTVSASRSGRAIAGFNVAPAPSQHQPAQHQPSFPACILEGPVSSVQGPGLSLLTPAQPLSVQGPGPSLLTPGQPLERSLGRPRASGEAVRLVPRHPRDGEDLPQISRRSPTWGQQARRGAASDAALQPGRRARDAQELGQGV